MMMLCDDRRPHHEHPFPPSFSTVVTYRCPGRPAPGTVAARTWQIIETAVLDGLHGDASGLDDGVAMAVRQLGLAELLAKSADTAHC